MASLTASGAACALAIGVKPPQALGRSADARVLCTADHLGRVLVVTFWASWCAPCLSEMRALESLQRQAAGRLAVVAVNIEDRRRFLALHRAQSGDLSLTLSHDDDGRVREAWGVGPIPHTFLIDHEGRLAGEYRGYDDAFIPVLVDRIRELLRRRAANAAASAS
ncbi:TlpA disulfide reductase family protein [Sinimarinibacterium sp. HSW-8]|uniref:TlpA disulfide reductase family protein n=2 Tax=Sinimarinibacterium thermocellulolyticum TaxID=3170016 RepID=A0ABV2A9Z9_9GAMM